MQNTKTQNMNDLIHIYCKSCKTNGVQNLIKSLWFSHGRLDVKRLNVLPVLLEQRNQKVDRQVQVGNQLIVAHLNVTDGNSQTENLFHLELDSRLESELENFSRQKSKFWTIIKIFVKKFWLKK